MKKIALLDAGAQYERLFIEMSEKKGYGVDKFPVNVPADALKDYGGIIITGGPRSVNDNDAILPNQGIWDLGIPVLGVCYGFHAMNKQLGGVVEKGKIGEYGRSNIEVLEKTGIFHNLGDHERVWMSHFDSVKDSGVAPSFKIIARSNGLVAAISNKEKGFYAVQFHPELLPMTVSGEKMFDNFFKQVCKLPEGGKRTVDDDIAKAEENIYQKLGRDKYVVQFLSGGVDSDVGTSLLSKCVESERLIVRFVDTGTMRKGEVKEVKDIAESLGLEDFQVVDGKDAFYYVLRDCVNPKEKRKLFNRVYKNIAMEIIGEVAKEKGVSLEKILFGQGTLRPDVIESGDKRATMGGAHEIKLHHNMGFEDIPRLEPFTDLFKENVRRMAVRFDLGEEIAFRQPFPGPGLYVRTVCMKEFSVDNEYNNLDRRVYELGKKRDLNVHVLPMRTVGVQGDERTVKHSAIVSGDIDWEECFEFVDELPNIERGVNRVLYFPGKPLSFDEVASITPTTMTRDVIAQAQEADFVMREIANDYGFNDARRCSQFPCSLTACSLGEEGKRMVVGRPFLTPHFMAGIAQRPESIKQLGDNPLEFYPDEMYERMAKEIPERVEGIVGFAMDGAHKPPATTEME